MLGVTHSIFGPGVLTKLPRLNLDGVEIRLAAEKDKAFAAELWPIIVTLALDSGVCCY